MRKLAVITTVAVVALLGAASAQDSSAPTPTAPAAPVAAPAAGTDLHSALIAYAAFHNDVSDLRAAQITNADTLETALDTVARHNKDGMVRGWVAYGAYTAAQSPAFVQGVRDAAAYYGRDAVVRAISADPYYARGLRGANEATRLVLDAANADGARVIAVADRYQEMAYGLQRQRWANAVAPAQAARVQRVRALGTPGGAPAVTLASDMTARFSVTPASLSPGSDPTVFGGRRFWDALRGGPNVTEVASTAPSAFRLNDSRGEAVHRMTTLAALETLDAADTPAAQQMLNDQRSRDCLEMAQLQLYQCMSAARFRYENAFCLGQHGLRDVGLCISAVATPDTAAMSPISLPASNAH